MAVSQNQGYPFWGPHKRTIVFWGLYWGPPIREITRQWGIWGSYYKIPKSIFYLLKGDYNPSFDQVMSYFVLK